ncbi:MAG TPA: ABC transporter ATP-binding protein [Thermomicrobiales bacterium]|nr:ABC transporter ATP-binding protein [Thermomicrobiales bacterium]
MPATTAETQRAHRQGDAPLLEIENLAIHFRSPKGVARVVDGTTLTIHRNEIVGVAGESGSGKTTLVEALLQIVRFPNRETRGRVMFTTRAGQKVDLMQLGPRQMRRLRLDEIAYVPQGSMNSLNPVVRVGTQIVDGMVDHGVGEREARRRVPGILERVGLEPRVAKLYPHELSGGMKQRVIIAIAISMNPALIIADEPTTALDVNVQRRILETLSRLRDELGVAILMVSHDLPVHAQLVDRVAVMYAGQIVETGDVRSVVKTPLHPYAKGLMQAIPSITKPRERLEGIRGTTPSPFAWPDGCRFHNRCPYAMEVCANVPPFIAGVRAGQRETVDGVMDVQPGREVACHLYPESTPDAEATS